MSCEKHQQLRNSLGTKEIAFERFVKIPVNKQAICHRPVLFPTQSQDVHRLLTRYSQAVFSFFRCSFSWYFWYQILQKILDRSRLRSARITYNIPARPAILPPRLREIFPPAKQVELALRLCLTTKLHDAVVNFSDCNFVRFHQVCIAKTSHDIASLDKQFRRGGAWLWSAQRRPGEPGCNFGCTSSSGNTFCRPRDRLLPATDKRHQLQELLRGQNRRLHRARSEQLFGLQVNFPDCNKRICYRLNSARPVKIARHTLHHFVIVGSSAHIYHVVVTSIKLIVLDFSASQTRPDTF